MPDTQLDDERAFDPSGNQSTAGPGAAGFFLVSPADGDARVPPNLAEVVVRGSAPVRPGATGASPFVVEDQRGHLHVPYQAQVAPCVEPAGTECHRLRLAAGLLPATPYRILVTSGTVLSDGRALDGGPIGGFSTAAAADTRAPVIAGLTIEVKECARVRFVLDEPGRAEVVFSAGGLSQSIEAALDAGVFSLTATLGGLPSGTEGTVVIKATDSAGNPVQSAPTAFAVPDRPVPLVMTEILANPAGSEYTQEWIEIWNTGAGPVDLAGLVIEDASGADTLPTVMLAPGQRALLVAAGFVADDPADAKLAVGTALVRVEGRLGRDGIGNAGEVLSLRSSDGRLISRYPGQLDMSATRWNGRSVRRTPEDSPCDEAAFWRGEPVTPTPGF